MGFFARLFGREDHIELQDVSGSPEEQEINQEQSDTLSSSDQSQQKPVDVSPFLEDYNDQK